MYIFLTICFDEINKSVRGCIVTRYRSVVAQFRFDSLSQLLAQFDTPLIVRVYIPNDALDEYLVLVQSCNQKFVTVAAKLQSCHKYKPISAPKVNGVIFFITILFVGRFPLNTLCGKMCSSSSPCSPCF